MIRILVLADIHLYLKRALDVISSERDIDYVFIAGDIGDIPTSCNVLRGIIQFLKQIYKITGTEPYVILGNHDCPKLLSLNIENVKIIKEGLFELKYGFKLIGISGTYSAPRGYNMIPLSDEEIFEKLIKLSKDTDSERLILLMHDPPSPTKLSKSFRGVHYGSKMLYKFIQEKQPLLCICGHIHEAHGMDTIGRTIIVNPGDLFSGYYAIITISDNLKIDVTFKRKL